MMEGCLCLQYLFVCFNRDTVVVVSFVVDGIATVEDV